MMNGNWGGEDRDDYTTINPALYTTNATSKFYMNGVGFLVCVCRRFLPAAYVPTPEYLLLLSNT